MSEAISASQTSTPGGSHSDGFQGSAFKQRLCDHMDSLWSS